MQPNKLIITVSGDGYNMQALDESGRVIADRTREIGATGNKVAGADFFVELPVQVAACVDAMDLALLDAVIALMPNQHDRHAENNRFDQLWCPVCAGTGECPHCNGECPECVGTGEAGHG